MQEIRFPDGTIKYIQASGEEETVFADGTVQRLLANGDRTIDYPDGQHELHTPTYSQRRYEGILGKEVGALMVVWSRQCPTWSCCLFLSFFSPQSFC